MKKIVLIVIISLFSFSMNALTLRNGAYAHKRRVKEVWNGLQEVKDYSLLLCFALYCKQQNIENLNLISGKKTFNIETIECGMPDNQTMSEWATLKITNNGFLDKETQEIIITTYFGDREQKFGVEAPKKIALAYPTYPIESWVEMIPGYTLVRLLKKIQHMHVVATQ